MAAVARPRYDPRRTQQFDGEIGLWPFVFHEPAKRSGRNRPAGTLKTKIISKIDRNKIWKMFVKNIIPAIKDKWPREG